jgi:hypothetical protein
MDQYCSAADSQRAWNIKVVLSRSTNTGFLIPQTDFFPMSLKFSNISSTSRSQKKKRDIYTRSQAEVLQNERLWTYCTLQWVTSEWKIYCLETVWRTTCPSDLRNHWLYSMFSRPGYLMRLARSLWWTRLEMSMVSFKTGAKSKIEWLSSR